MYAFFLDIDMKGSVIFSAPEELSHREACVLQQRAEQLGQVQPYVGNVDGHVVGQLQRLCKPEKPQRCIRA